MNATAPLSSVQQGQPCSTETAHKAQPFTPCKIYY